MRRFYLPVALIALIAAFWFSPDAQEIAAGVAIFLFGMLMLEDGFKLFSGGTLERLLARTTGSTPRALAFGIFSTALLQSSSLVSVITISFLSAGLVTLAGGVGIIFGANIGTTTGAWLVAGLGLKVDIATYAMPMIALGIVLVFQQSKPLRGLGYALGGLGFLFLGIHHMKTGFEAFRDEIDLMRFALPGLLGLAVYTLVGTSATVIMQSSHATMVLVLTALAAGQISYENALALAIGANIGTTITAIIGSLGANFQGRRLALAHLVFNMTTAAVALAFIVPLREAVDFISDLAGIAPDDFALKLAVFHTIFNLLGVVIMLPAMARLIGFLERRIPEPVPDLSVPLFLNEAVDNFPQTLESALRKEVRHLYENAETLILHGLNLHPGGLFGHTPIGPEDVEETVGRSRKTFEIDMEEEYERKVKTLFSAIVDFTTRVSDKKMPQEIAANIYALRDVASRIVQAVKSVKHLRKNVQRYTTRKQGAITGLYDDLRTQIACIMIEIRALENTAPEDRSALTLDHEQAQLESDRRQTMQRIETLIRQGAIRPDAATSFMNDSGYAYSAMRDLIEAARTYYIASDRGEAEVERLLAFDEEELADAGDGSHKSFIKGQQDDRE